MIDFDNVENFKRWQFDDPRFCQVCSGWNIDEEIVYILDHIVTRTGWKAVPHWSVFGCVVMDHAMDDYRFCKSKWHLRENNCKAIDFHFITEATPKEQFKVLYDSSVTGLGIFTNLGLSTKDKDVVSLLDIAFHIDVGDKERNIWVYPDNNKINLTEWVK